MHTHTHTELIRIRILGSTPPPSFLSSKASRILARTDAMTKPTDATPATDVPSMSDAEWATFIQKLMEFKETGRYGDEFVPERDFPLFFGDAPPNHPYPAAFGAFQD